jgi:hypothetical protein
MTKYIKVPAKNRKSPRLLLPASIMPKKTKVWSKKTNIRVCGLVFVTKQSSIHQVIDIENRRGMIFSFASLINAFMHDTCPEK